MRHMAQADATPPANSPLLVVEDDPDTRESLGLMLEDAGYAAHLAPSVKEALAAIDERVFALVVTDLFARASKDLFKAAITIRDRAYPTPVGVLSGWSISAKHTPPDGFAFIMSKPFDIDELLTSVAVALASPLTPDQQRQIDIVHAYFAALGAHDWDALLSLCADDIVYALPGIGPFSNVISGKANFRVFTEQTFQQFPAARFDQIQCYSTPQGLAARYHGMWLSHDNVELHQTGSVLFQFDDVKIRQIGVRLNDSRLQALIGSAQPPTPSTPEG